MKVSKEKRILVTGGAGFIGSNLVDELIKRGNKVVVIDNLSTGKIENVNSVADFHQLDIRNLNKIKSIFNNIDYVFHLAALPNVELSIKDPASSNDINLNGTSNVLIASKDAKVKKVIYSSSSSVYGNQEKIPLSEKLPENPISPYGLHKYFSELNCKLFTKIYGLNTVCLRYFNVYGKRQSMEGSYSSVISIFSKKYSEKKSLPIVGDGEQKRDFIFVDDVVRANIMAAENSYTGNGEVINIGSGKSYTVNEIAKIFGGLTENIPSRIEPRESLADIFFAKKIINWEPTVNLLDWLSQYKKEIELD